MSRENSKAEARKGQRGWARAVPSGIVMVAALAVPELTVGAGVFGTGALQTDPARQPFASRQGQKEPIAGSSQYVPADPAYSPVPQTARRSAMTTAAHILAAPAPLDPLSANVEAPLRPVTPPPRAIGSDGNTDLSAVTQTSLFRSGPGVSAGQMRMPLPVAVASAAVIIRPEDTPGFAAMIEPVILPGVALDTIRDTVAVQVPDQSAMTALTSATTSLADVSPATVAVAAALPQALPPTIPPAGKTDLPAERAPLLADAMSVPGLVSAESSAPLAASPSVRPSRMDRAAVAPVAPRPPLAAAKAARKADPAPASVPASKPAADLVAAVPIARLRPSSTSAEVRPVTAPAPDATARLVARVDGKTAGTLDMQQTPSGLAIRLGSLVDVLADRYDAAELTRIRSSAASNAYLPLAALQAQGIPISYDPVYDEFNVGEGDYRPKAGSKVHIDQISAPERKASVGIAQIRP